MLGSPRNKRHDGYTLIELLAAAAIVSVLAAMLIPRTVQHITAGSAAACDAHKGEIEIQVQLWRRNHGTWPAATLSDIKLDAAYFPEGLPTCPVDGSAYTIDANTGRVIGHTH